VTSSTAIFERTAWLYTRGETSVTMTVHQERGGVSVAVLGPGSASASYPFKTLAAAVAFVEAQQEKLHEQGFQLHAFTDRRRGYDRREGSRDEAEERRRQ
jgi:hypothetical protein